MRVKSDPDEGRRAGVDAKPREGSCKRCPTDSNCPSGSILPGAGNQVREFTAQRQR